MGSTKQGMVVHLLLGLSLSSVLAQEIDYKAAEKVIDEASRETGSLVAQEIIEHNKGHYPRLAREGSLGQIQHAWDKAGKGSGTLNITYSQGQVIPLRLREFMITTIILPSWEKIVEIRVGDPGSFEALKSTQHILVMQPIESIGVDSNVVVIGGSGLVYSFYVRSEGYNSQHISESIVNVHVPGEVPQSFPELIQDEGGSFRKSTPPSSVRNSSPSETYPQEIPPKMDELDFRWAMSGDSEIAPRQVFSDGVRTWFNFAERFDKQRLPIISLVRDGVDTPVNFRIEGTMIVAMGVGVFTLRNGKKVVCVYPSYPKKA